jgi:hypothetical protein
MKKERLKENIYDMSKPSCKGKHHNSRQMIENGDDNRNTYYGLKPTTSMVHMLKNIKWQLPPSTLLLVEKQKQSLKGTLYLMAVQLEAQTKLMKQREPV